MIHNFTSWRLNESLSSARARFLKPGLVDQETFDQLKSLDPTPTFKYLEKIIGFYLNDKAPIEELKDIISRFHTLLGKNQVHTRDINAFKSFSDLKSETQSSDAQYVSKQETKARAKDYDLVHEDKDWIVVIPHTHEASCRYGAGTKWCTSSQDPEHYKTYTRRGITLYYIISKRLSIENRFYKMAVAVGSNGKKECFDSRDKSITLKKILEVTGLDKSIFVSRPNRLTPYEILGLDESKITENTDGTIDYDGDVNALETSIEKIPINFNSVSGNFFIGDSLKTLWGAPKDVGGTFDCVENKLTSLQGAPEKVGMYFRCANNYLTDLEGSPKEVGAHFDCRNNRLTSLKGVPKNIGGDFLCSGNPDLPESEKEWARKNIKARGFYF